MNYFDDSIESRLLSLHTAFLAKVISTDGKTAKVQPLNNIKGANGEVRQQAVLDNIPVLKSVKKYEYENVTTTSGGDPSHTHTVKTVKLVDVAAGDVVFCLCGERELAGGKGGNTYTPSIGHHMLSDAVVIGVL